jgi:hypothetical protein
VINILNTKKLLSIVIIILISSISLITAVYFFEHENNVVIDTNVNNTTNVTVNDTNVSVESILNASQEVKEFKENNKILPSHVMVDDENCTMEQFLYLISKAIVNIKMDNNSSIEVLSDINQTSIEVLSDVNQTNSIGDNWDGELNKTSYLLNATNIVAGVEESREVPNFLMTNLGNISFNSTVYGFATIGDFIKNNGTFPESISFNGTEGGKKYRWDYVTELANWLYENHEYNVTGDCYTFSDIVAKKLAEQGYQCGIIQGTTELGNHRVVMVIVNGERQWFETCRCVKGGWGINPDKWNEQYSSWKPEFLYKGFNGFTYP